METSQSRHTDVAVIGAGAAGMFFTHVLHDLDPNIRIAVFEMGNKALAKVKISGGGRCNVTHACFDPRELVKFYPRGNKELRSGFSRFCTGDTMEWFEHRGVKLKIEEDGRIFPQTDSSQTVIDCLMRVTQQPDVHLHLKQGVKSILREQDHWKLLTSSGPVTAREVLLATGGSQAAWQMLANLGLPIVPPVPSLFTFKVPDFPWKDLAGLSLPGVEVRVSGLKQFKTEGPFLITHWGFSGPAILRMSAEAARELHELDYHFEVALNLLPSLTAPESQEQLKNLRGRLAKKKVVNHPFQGLPARLWNRLAEETGASELRWADLSNKTIEALAERLHRCTFPVTGKSTHKEEFVTAGGIELRSINFRTMEAKNYPGLYFAGEVLDIDAVTGGFNFQAAWTTAWVAAQAVAEKYAAARSRK